MAMKDLLKPDAQRKSQGGVSGSTSYQKEELRESAPKGKKARRGLSTEQ